MLLGVVYLPEDEFAVLGRCPRGAPHHEDAPSPARARGHSPERGRVPWGAYGLILAEAEFPSDEALAAFFRVFPI
jgi:hypothetical protein